MMKKTIRRTAAAGLTAALSLSILGLTPSSASARDTSWDRSAPTGTTSVVYRDWYSVTK